MYSGSLQVDVFDLSKSFLLLPTQMNTAFQIQKEKSAKTL